MSNKIREISIAKGIGILFVVLGHTISPVMTDNAFLSATYSFIYYFHMPLFFFLAGIVYTKAVQAEGSIEKFQLIKKRAVRLMVPYFAWALLYTPLKIIMSGQARFSYDIADLWTLFIGNNPDGEMWFLYVLFVFSLIAILMVNKKNIHIYLVVFSLISFISPLLIASLPGISMSFSLFQIAFFFAGIYFTPKKVWIFNNWKLFIVSLLSFAGYLTLNSLLSLNLWFLKMIPAASGICIIMFISGYLANLPRISKALEHIGEYSMDIYIFHAPILVISRTLFLNFLSVSSGEYILITNLIAIPVSLVISRCIVRRIKLLRLLFLGMEKV